MPKRISFFESYHDAVADLPPEVYKAALEALFNYCFHGTEPEGLTGMAKMFFCLVKPTVEKGMQLEENGSHGGRPKTKNQTENFSKPTESITENQTENFSKPTEKLTQNQTENFSKPDKDMEKDMEKDMDMDKELGNGGRKRSKDLDEDMECVCRTQPARKRAFHAPTVEEVRAYCTERHNAVDPERFVDYYESNGWHVGKNPMKDWQAAVRTWERGDNGGQGYKPAERSGTTRQSPLDVAAEVMRRIADEGKESAYDTRGNQ